MDCINQVGKRARAYSMLQRAGTGFIFVGLVKVLWQAPGSCGSLCRPAHLGTFGVKKMGTIHRFPRRYRHARASSTSWAAKRTRRSKVTPACLAFSVDKTAGHHLDGIDPLPHHLITAQFLAPTSDAMASREDQSSMTERCDVIWESESTMAESLGHIVPDCKAIMVRDLKSPVGHSVPMDAEPEKIAESAWQKAFRERLSRIQGRRTHEAMAEFLCMSVESWKKCVNRGDSFPLRKLTKLALLAGIPVESLIKGDRDDELPPVIERYKKRTATAKRRSG